MLFNKVDKKTVYELIKKDINNVPPEIRIHYDVLLDFKAYADECDKEIGWLALVREVEKNKVYEIYDTILPKQKVTGVTTELDEEDLVNIAEEMLKTNPDEYDNVKCWCHSHVNMDVFASATDEDTFEQYYNNSDYFIRIIVNKKGDIKIDYANLDEQIKFENMEFTTIYPKEIQDNLNKINMQKKKTEETIKKAEENIKNIVSVEYDKIKSSLKETIKNKVTTNYSATTTLNKKAEKNYSRYYGYNGFYDDYYDESYNYEPYSDKSKKKEEDDLLDINLILYSTEWNELSTKDKMSLLEIAYSKNLLEKISEYADNDEMFIQIAEAQEEEDLYNILCESDSFVRYIESSYEVCDSSTFAQALEIIAKGLFYKICEENADIDDYIELLNNGGLVI